MKVVFKSKLLILMMCAGIGLNNSFAQNSSIINDSIYSQVLNEERELKILLPEEYQPGSDEKYDVVYILDGERHYDDFIGIYKFLRRENFIPPLIIIGLPNKYTSDGNMRDRDFLPEKSTDNVKAGGAGNFIAFFKNELIPYVNKKLPVTGDNNLFGHSLG